MAQTFEEQRPRPLRPAPSGSRVPPHNLEAEESLLGAMLLSADAASAAVEICQASDFYKPAHGHIFGAVVALLERGEPVDAVTVTDELRRSGLLESVGDPALLVTLQAGTPSIANAAHYAHIVEEHALLRRLVGVAGEIADIGYSVPEDVTGALDEAESMVFNVAQRRTVDTMAQLNDLLTPSLERIEALYERKETVTGLATGYLDLDEMLAGLQPSSLSIVGARPSMGKTAFALGIVAHVGVIVRRPVLLFSLEMGQLELTQRLLSSEGLVDAHRLRTGHLRDSDWPKIGTATSKLSDAPIFIDDNPNATVMDIRGRARRLKKNQGDLGLVVVDYLQLMTGAKGARTESRQVEVAEISRGLKILARELEVPVVALSQLSRGLEARQDKRPMLSDLRESGCLTADTMVTRADTGASVSLGELLLTGARDIPVWSLDEDYRLVPATMTHVFPSGVKPVFELRLASGRRVRASANHPFRTLDGWTPLEHLHPGDRLAVPRTLPEPTGSGRAGRATPARKGRRCGGLARYRDTASQHAAGAVAVLEDPDLERLAQSDVLWDTVVAIEPAGEEPVYDATVLGTHNFLANGIVAHNSLEQDADIVLFIYREEAYDPEAPVDRRGMAEIVVAKHRNGRVGSIQLSFRSEFARFDNMAKM